MSTSKDCSYVKNSFKFKYNHNIHAKNRRKWEKKPETNLNLNFSARLNRIVLIFFLIILSSGVMSEFLGQANFVFAQIELKSTNNSNNEKDDFLSSEPMSSTLNETIDDKLSNEVQGDFNGDGFDDIAIGVPGEDLRTAGRTVSNAGAVSVLYGSSDGLSASSPYIAQFWTQATSNVPESPEQDDSFGFSLSSADFNGDGFGDIAIGVPGESVPIVNSTANMSGAGGVNVLYGSSNGLSAISPLPGQFWSQATSNVQDSPESNDSFAKSLSAGDFNGDGFGDIAIGVSGEDVETPDGTVSNAGAINVLYGSSDGVSASSPQIDQFWTQATSNVTGSPEQDDSFGFSISSADFNGDGLTDIAIGVPGESVTTVDSTANISSTASADTMENSTATVASAGAVNVLYGSSNGLSTSSTQPGQYWTQYSDGIENYPEEADQFGSALD